MTARQIPMKTSNYKSQRGSILLVTMIFILAIAAALYGYLALIQNSNLQVARAQTWNAALPVAEAGIDEGMALLNSTVGIDQTNVVGGFNYVLSHDLDDRTYDGTYDVRFDDFGNLQRFLTATGFVTAPITGDLIKRTVKVGVQRQKLFSKGMVALDFINMNGNSIAADSYNSHDPSQSNNGLWNGYSGTNGDIAAVNGYVNLGNQTIQGDLYLGPTATYDGSGTVSGTTYTDSNMQYQSAQDPSGSSAWPSYPITSYLDSATGKTYSAHNFTNNGSYVVYDSNPIYVQPGVTVNLRIATSSWSPSSVNILGGTANSGTLNVWVDSGNITLKGNSSGGASASQPENFYVWCLPAVTSVTFSGNSDFVGVIYAPDTPLTLNGGGGNVNFIGAVVAKSVTMNGHYHFHYDTYLQYSYYGVYVVGSWQEF